MPDWRLVGGVTDASGRVVVVGVAGGRVTVRTSGTLHSSAVELDGAQAEQFAHLYLSACWQAAQELAGKEAA